MSDHFVEACTYLAIAVQPFDPPTGLLDRAARARVKELWQRVRQPRYLDTFGGLEDLEARLRSDFDRRYGKGFSETGAPIARPFPDAVARLIEGLHRLRDSNCPTSDASAEAFRERVRHGLPWLLAFIAGCHKPEGAEP